MKFLMIYTPARTEASGPDAARGAAMREYSERMSAAGVLLSQAMLAPDAAEVRLHGGGVAVTDVREPAVGYAFISAPSRAAAIEGAKEFLAVAGDGLTLIREVLEGPPRPA